MDNEKETFQYTYSAKERSEVENIRKKYIMQEESKLEQLRKLDRSAAQKAQVWALTLGVIGALVLGSGMSLFMSDLGELLGFSWALAMAAGIGLGLVGLVLIALAYPAYNSILQKERKRIAPEILRLTEELIK